MTHSVFQIFLLIGLASFVVPASIAPGYNPIPAPVTCATVRCAAGSTCRQVRNGGRRGDMRVECVDDKKLDIDYVCTRQNYLQVLLERHRRNPDLYRPRRCHRRRPCPSGSTCVRGFGGRYCCTGKADRCGGKCERGEQCVDKPVQCPPGKFCIQALVPTCVKDGCVNCKADEECVVAPYQPACLPDMYCPTIYHCQKKSDCSPPCPPGETCKVAATVCSDPPPGVNPDPAIYGCFKQYECQKDDDCGGCPAGQTCNTYHTPCMPPPSPCPGPVHVCEPSK